MLEYCYKRINQNRHFASKAATQIPYTRPLKWYMLTFKRLSLQIVNTRRALPLLKEGHVFPAVNTLTRWRHLTTERFSFWRNVRVKAVEIGLRVLSRHARR